MNIRYITKSLCSVVAVITVITVSIPYVSFAQTAQTLNSAPTANEDPNVSGFRIVVCDGPDLSTLKATTTVMFNGKSVDTTVGSNPQGYIPCNFNGAMIQIQHLIDLAMVLGVLGAMLGFSYAGYLYITGEKGKIDHAKTIFKQVMIGFVMMISAWFIVYQILSWLASNPNVTTLLGKP